MKKLEVVTVEVGCEEDLPNEAMAELRRVALSWDEMSAGVRRFVVPRDAIATLKRVMRICPAFS